MRNYMRAIFALSALCLSSGLAEAETKTFENPMIGTNRLDWCVNWGTGCGADAATAWCKSNAYDHSVDIKQAPDIGASSPTKLIATGEVCDQSYCDGFASITCAAVELPASPPPAAAEASEAEASEAEAPTPAPVVAKAAERNVQESNARGGSPELVFQRAKWLREKSCRGLVRATGIQHGEGFQVCQRGKAHDPNWHRRDNKKGSQRLQPRYLREVGFFGACCYRQSRATPRQAFAATCSSLRPATACDIKRVGSGNTDVRFIVP